VIWSIRVVEEWRWRVEKSGICVYRDGTGGEGQVRKDKREKDTGGKAQWGIGVYL
jgi:hypothetical protein